MAVCGAGAAVAAIAVYQVLSAPPLARLLAVAFVIVAVYAALLARIEKVTPRSVLRAVRGVPDDTTPASRT